MKKNPESSPSPTILQGTHSPIIGNNRRAISVGAVIVILAILVVGVVLVFTYIPANVASGIKFPGQPTTSTTSGVLAGNVPGKIQFVITNALSGAAATPTTFKVYPAAGSVIGGQSYGGLTPSETVTISSGTGTTADFYPPGTVLFIYELLSGSQTQYQKIVAPGVTPAMQAQGTAAQVNLNEQTIPTLSITVTDNKGNTYTSGTTVSNFTSSGHCPANNKCLGQTSTTFTVTVTNTAANSGYVETYDPINSQNWCFAQQMIENGTDVNEVGVTGFPAAGGSFNVGSTRYWQNTMAGGLNLGATNIIQSGYFSPSPTNNCASYSLGTGGISGQTQGTQNIGGSVSFGFTVNQNGQDAGDSFTLTLSFYRLYDPAYAAANSGSGGATVAQFAGAFFHLKFAS